VTIDQEELLVAARKNIDGAKKLLEIGLSGIAASRAYYAMFYIAQAFLLEKGLAFSKHQGTISGFGKEICMAGRVPVEYHRYIIEAFDYRSEADYEKPHSVAPEIAEEQIIRAEMFIELAEREL
jgi:uncharacterized protein (UPF0332 family)